MSGDEEIDYLHPDGKPNSGKDNELTAGDSARPDYKSYEHALQEADGHSMKKADPYLHPEDAG